MPRLPDAHIRPESANQFAHKPWPYPACPGPYWSPAGSAVVDAETPFTAPLPGKYKSTATFLSDGGKLRRFLRRKHLKQGFMPHADHSMPQDKPSGLPESDTAQRDGCPV